MTGGITIKMAIKNILSSVDRFLMFKHPFVKSHYKDLVRFRSFNLRRE